MQRSNLSFLLAFAGVLLVAPMAQGLSVTPTDLSIYGTSTSGGSLAGTIHVQAVRSGAPPGATLFEGNPGPTDPTIVFDITLDPNSAPLAYVDVMAVVANVATAIAPTGIGWVPGNGSSSEPDGLVDPSAGMVVMIYQGPAIGPDADFSVGVQGGEQTNLLFVSYGQLPVGGLILTTPGGIFQIVPEPAPDVLLGVALLALAGSGTIRRRRVQLRRHSPGR